MDLYLRPNWKDGVRETFEFRTTVFTTDSGREQRSAERINPRRTVEFQSTLQGDTLRHVKASISSRQNYLCQMPEPIAVASTLRAFAPVGSTRLNLSEAIDPAHIGRRVCVHDGTSFIFAEIENADVDERTIRTVAPTQAAMSAGATVRLCIPGRMPASASLRYVTDDLATVPVTFHQVAGMAGQGDSGPVVVTSFNDREVLMLKPDWSSPPNVEIITPYEETDFGRGVTLAYAPITFPSRISEFNYTGQRMGEIAYLTGFFARHLGRLHEFWCPSWVSDMRLAQPITSGTSQVVIAGRRTGDLYSHRRVDRAFAIRLLDGSMRYFTVDNIETDGTNTILTTTHPLNFNTSVDGHIGLYWLNVCRFATDAMTVRWLTDQVGQTVLNITTLEALFPDTL